MQGMHADGKKATGFRSMVVAQFTAVSLQKDDRAFVKYDASNRSYSGIQFSKQTGALTYHLNHHQQIQIQYII